MSISEWRCRKYDGDAKDAYYSWYFAHCCWISLEVHWKTSRRYFCEKRKRYLLFSYHYMYCVKYCIIFHYVYNKSIQIRNRWIQLWILICLIFIYQKNSLHKLRLKDRETSRLMVLDQETGEIEHEHFTNITNLFTRRGIA